MSYGQTREFVAESIASYVEAFPEVSEPFLISIIESNVDLFDAKIRSFLDACKNGTEAPVPSWQILYNQAIIDGIARSAAIGREVEIEIPEI